jgi:hypothetical protein
MQMVGLNLKFGHGVRRVNHLNSRDVIGVGQFHHANLGDLHV